MARIRGNHSRFFFCHTRKGGERERRVDGGGGRVMERERESERERERERDRERERGGEYMNTSKSSFYSSIYLCVCVRF